MDENTKRILYKQIVEMYENNLNEMPIVSEQEYLNFSSKDALGYIFSYRDLADFGNDENDGSRITYYIELPDMDLSGEDLTGIKISEFIPAIFDENGKLCPSDINFENSNVSIDLSDIGYTRSEEIDNGITDYIIDFEKMNFNGCLLYGILPDEYSDCELNPKSKIKSQYKVLNREGHLDKRYIARREENHLSMDDKKVSDKAYQRIISGKMLKGMRGVNERAINLIDYDFCRLNENQIEALMDAFVNYEIKLDYNVLVQDHVVEFFYKLVDKDQNLFQKLMYGYAIEAINDGELKFIEKYFDYLSEEIKREIIMVAYRNRNMRVLERYFKYLPEEYKKNFVMEECRKGNFEKLEFYWDSLSNKTKTMVTQYAFEIKKFEFVDKHLNCLQEDGKALYAYVKGDIKFIDKTFDVLSEDIKYQVVQEAFERNDFDFVEKHLGALSIEHRRQLVRFAYEMGNKEFSKKYFEYLLNRTKKLLVQEAYENGNFKFVEEHFYYLEDESKRDIMKKAYEEGNTEYIERNFESLFNATKGELVRYAYEKGDIEFVDKYFRFLDDKSKYEIMQYLYEKGDIEFVDCHLKDVALQYRDNIILFAMKKGDDKFVEKHYKKMSKIKRQVYEEKKNSAMIIKAYDNGDMEYVENNIGQLSVDLTGKLVEHAFQKGDIEFVDRHYKDLYLWVQDDLVKQSYEKGFLEFVESHFNYISGDTQNEIVQRAYEKGDIEFVDKFFKYISIRDKLIFQAYKNGDAEFVENHYEQLHSRNKDEIVVIAYKKGDVAFVERHLEDISLIAKRNILQQACQKGDIEYVRRQYIKLRPTEKRNIIYELIKNNSDDINKLRDIIADYIEVEKNITEMAGKKEQSCSGHLLYEIITMDNVSADVIVMLIKAGSNVEYIAYESTKTSNTESIVTYTPILMKALEIQDENKKEQIVKALLEAGVNKQAKTTKIFFTSDGRKKEIYTAMQDEFFLSTLNDFETDRIAHKLLKDEIGLTEQEIMDLELTFQEFGNSIYKCSYDKLKKQKDILAAIGCEKAGFTKYARVLFFDPMVMYSRLKFFIDNGIEVNSEDLYKTLAATNKKFTITYGAKVLGTDKQVDESQVTDVKKALLKRYPMPLQNKQLLDDLKRIRDIYSKKERCWYAVWK